MNRLLPCESHFFPLRLFFVETGKNNMRLKVKQLKRNKKRKKEKFRFCATPNVFSVESVAHNSFSVALSSSTSRPTASASGVDVSASEKSRKLATHFRRFSRQKLGLGLQATLVDEQLCANMEEKLTQLGCSHKRNLPVFSSSVYLA